MTEEQINWAVASACGWTPCGHDGDGLCGDPACNKWYPPGKNIETAIAMDVPNYCADLNAMHEAEKALDYGQAVTYLKTLDEIVRRDPMGGIWSHFVHATARQRAEAFLRTLGKWQDTPQPQTVDTLT
jgi:hypothetical protein